MHPNSIKRKDSRVRKRIAKAARNARKVGMGTHRKRPGSVTRTLGEAVERGYDRSYFN